MQTLGIGKQEHRLLGVKMADEGTGFEDDLFGEEREEDEEQEQEEEDDF